MSKKKKKEKKHEEIMTIKTQDSTRTTTKKQDRLHDTLLHKVLLYHAGLQVFRTLLYYTTTHTQPPAETVIKENISSSRKTYNNVMLF